MQQDDQAAVNILIPIGIIIVALLAAILCVLIFGPPTKQVLEGLSRIAVWIGVGLVVVILIIVGWAYAMGLVNVSGVEEDGWFESDETAANFFGDALLNFPQGRGLEKVTKFPKSIWARPPGSRRYRTALAAGERDNVVKARVALRG